MVAATCVIMAFFECLVALRRPLLAFIICYILYCLILAPVLENAEIQYSTGYVLLYDVNESDFWLRFAVYTAIVMLLILTGTCEMICQRYGDVNDDEFYIV